MGTFASDTSGRTAADWGKALLILLAGLTIAHLGVTLFLQANMGTDTFTVLIQGTLSLYRTYRWHGPCNRSVSADGRHAADYQRLRQARNRCLRFLRRPYH